jgi:hypothetical protein
MSIDLPRLSRALNLVLSLRGRGLALSIEAGELRLALGLHDQQTADDCKVQLRDLVSADELGAIVPPADPQLRQWFSNLNSPTQQQLYSASVRALKRLGRTHVESERVARELVEDYWAGRRRHAEQVREWKERRREDGAM